MTHVIYYVIVFCHRIFLYSIFLVYLVNRIFFPGFISQGILNEIFCRRSINYKIKIYHIGIYYKLY